MTEHLVPKYNLYRITHRPTAITVYKPAPTAHAACQLAGWDIGDCHVQHIEPEWKKDLDGTPRFLIKVPCTVCPFQYATCNKPSYQPCPVHLQAPELIEWLKRATEAHTCPYVGRSIPKEDHTQQQVWLPLDDAIAYFTAQLR